MRKLQFLITSSYWSRCTVIFELWHLRGTTSLTAWKKVIFVNFFLKYRIECFKIFQIYLCINNEYKVIFSDENIRFSASYPPSPESSKRKSSPTAAVIVAFTVFEIKKTKNFMKLEYISYKMTVDYKKKKMRQNAGFKKKKFCSKLWWFLAWKNYIFHLIIKMEGHCVGKQIHN